MKRTVLLLVSALALALGALPAAAQSPGQAPLHRATGEAVDGSYIVVMKPGRAADVAAEHAGVRPTRVYEHVLNGFAARLDDRELDALRRNPNVAYVEEDQVATVLGQPSARRDAGGRPEARTDGAGAAGTLAAPPWNLDRLDQRYLPLDGSYTVNTSAAHVDIYIVGTGIQTNHPALIKALRGFDVFGGNSEDCHGHGTHMAGIASSPDWGVAKDAYLWSVRVLNCNGSGTYSGIIAGTDWIRSHAASWPTYPAIASYSLGGGYSAALNAAIDALSNSGVFVAVASGGSNADACNFSPSSATTPFTANVSDASDRRASFSNYGPCTDGYAPGVNVTSAWLGGGLYTISGTSVGSPHVAGVAALYKAKYGDAPSATVKNWIVNNATRDVITGNPPATPNRLLYKANL